MARTSQKSRIPKAPRKSHASKVAARKSSPSGSEYDKMTVVQLKQLLEDRGVDWKLLPKSGKSTHIKKDFIDALKEDDAGPGIIPKKKVVKPESPPKKPADGFKPGKGIADMFPSPVKPKNKAPKPLPEKPEDKPKPTPQKQTTFSFTYKLGAAIYTYPDEPANTTFRTILTRIVSKWFGGHNIKDYQIYDDEDKLVTDYDQPLDNYEESTVFTILGNRYNNRSEEKPKKPKVSKVKPKKNTSKEGSPPKVKKCLLPDQEVYIICFWDKEAYDHNPDMGGQDASYVLPNFHWDNRISAAREFLKDTNPKLAALASEELGDMMGGMSSGVTYNNDLYYIDMFKGKVLKNM